MRCLQYSLLTHLSGHVEFGRRYAEHLDRVLERVKQRERRHMR